MHLSYFDEKLEKVAFSHLWMSNIRKESYGEVMLWALQNVAANALCCFDATAIFAVTLKTINFFPLFEITKKENLHVSFSPRDLEVTTVLSEPPTLFLMQMQ